MTTEHNHGANFGRKIDGCPRCEELKAGASPVSWSWTKRAAEQRQLQAIRRHNCKESNCGIVCTFGEW